MRKTLLPIALTLISIVFLSYGCQSLLFSTVKDYETIKVQRNAEEWRKYQEVERWEDEEALLNGIDTGPYYFTLADPEIDRWTLSNSFETKDKGVIVKVNEVTVRTETGTELEVEYTPMEFEIEWNDFVGYYRRNENDFVSFTLDYKNEEAVTIGVNLSVTNQGTTVTETREYTFYPSWREQFNFAM